MARVMQPMFLRGGSADGLQAITVRHKFGNHTLAYLDFDYQKAKQYVLPPERTPVALRWGKSPLGVSTTYGYVNHYDTTGNDSNTRKDSTRMVIIGTSALMNSTVPTNWETTTRSAIARDIAKRYQLRSVIHKHPAVVGSWASGVRTDLQVLQALAQETGYQFWVDGSTLFFLDPKRIILGAENMTIPYFEKKNIRGSKITGGSNAPNEYGNARRRVIFGLDNGTNQFFVATGGNPVHPVEMLPVRTGSYGEADTLTAAGDLNDMNYYTAEVVVDGNAKIIPGSVVRLAPGNISNDIGGYWIVNQALHEMTLNDFKTTMQLTRTIDQIPGVRTSTIVRGVNLSAPAVIRNGSTWEAEIQERVDV